MINVVVSRYNRNIDFVETLRDVAPVNLMVYDKEKPENPFNVPVNKGCEASVYLKYIVDHYDSLSEWTFFIHDENRSWHHDGTISERFKEAIDAGTPFYNINNQYFQSVKDIKQQKELMEYYRQCIEEFIPYEKLPNKDWLAGGTYKFAAQFLVHRSLILGLPKRFYEGLYDFSISSEYDHKWPAFCLEWTWHLFWDVYPKFRHLFP